MSRLMSEKAETQAQNTGQITNDVGNTVIVPKENESFADTMKRAAAYGKTVTPQQINAELATAPKKAATVLAAAPVIGAAVLLLCLLRVKYRVRVNVCWQMTESQLQRFAEAYPHLSKLQPISVFQQHRWDMPLRISATVIRSSATNVHPQPDISPGADKAAAPAAPITGAAASTVAAFFGAVANSALIC